jgi:hypothetical protein
MQSTNKELPDGCECEQSVGFFKVNDTNIPLYTHPADLTDEEIVDIIERLIADWTNAFKNYEYNSDEPEENKLRDDVFAILKKASER